MKRLLLFSIICLALAQTSKAQTETIYNFNLGAFAGVSSYHGDLVESNLDQIAETHPAFGLYLRFNYGDYFSARSTITYGSMSGTDANANDVSRRKRNLSFRSPIVEFSIVPEGNIYNFVLPRSGYVITPFVYAGIGGFWFNPQAFYEGEWVNLQPLATEGQELPGNSELKKYNRFAIAIPYGLGVKFKMSEYTTISWEFGYRYTFTDYLDDLGGYYADKDVLQVQGATAVALSDRSMEYGAAENAAGSIRASTKSNDFYIFTGFSLSINLSPKKTKP